MPSAPYPKRSGSVTSTVAFSPTVMDVSAASQPRIMIPSPTMTFCELDLAKGCEAPGTEHVYLTVATSPKFSCRPDPGFTTVLLNPSGRVPAAEEKSWLLLLLPLHALSRDNCDVEVGYEYAAG